MSAESHTETIKLASIVSIDVAGFSSLSERDQRRAASHIATLHDRIGQVASKHGGRIFNTAGDGFMLEFAAAGAALAAIQELLDLRKRGEPRIRVGAHVGDVIVTINNDLLGHGVNVAARLQSLAEPGAALVSGEFRSMARNSPQAAFQARGRQPLENMEERVHTFEILSRRKRTERVVKRVGVGLAAVVIAAAIGVATPFAVKFGRAQGWIEGGQAQTAEAATPVVEPVAAPVTPAAAEASAAARWTAAQTFKDCEFCPEMTVVPAGRLNMGSAVNEAGSFANERPQHQVDIAMFAVSTNEVTFAEWDACLATGGCGGFSPSDRGFGRGPRPVLGVSWNDAQAYVRWLNARTEGGYRLLTESEWEYAARAGTSTPYATGPRISRDDAVFGARATQDVGGRAANQFGLKDMHGNAWEWVEDCYVQTYDGAPGDGAAVTAARCAAHAYRGGGYRDPASALRSANRRRAGPDVRDGNIGFRIARTLPD
ncbi:MAG: SUMF1/EgtB/PvdO family nonheme iron enzyme [Caulobacterales bacterium]